MVISLNAKFGNDNIVLTHSIIPVLVTTPEALTARSARSGSTGTPPTARRTHADPAPAHFRKTSRRQIMNAFHDSNAGDGTGGVKPKFAYRQINSPFLIKS